MAKLGTAYVEVKPDLSAFGAGLGEEIKAKLKALGSGALTDIKQKVTVDVDKSQLAQVAQAASHGLQDVHIAVDAADVAKLKAVATDLREFNGIDATARVDVKTDQATAELAIFRQRLNELRGMEASPKVTLEIGRVLAKIETLEARIVKLGHEKAEIKVDIDRNTSSTLASFASSVGQAFRGIAQAAGGFLGVGGAFTSLGSAAAAAAPLVAGLAVAVGILAASFGAAVAGAGALGIALAGALGPAAIVAFAALARIAVIIKAIHDDSTQSAASTQAVASAQDQLKAATEGVANAQANLSQQAVAGFQAMQDAAEAVKDDVLGIQDAQLGIADAALSLKEAQLELKNFKKEAGPSLNNVFKKFTDVNVDLSGLKGALDAARKASGGKFSEDDSLKLERLILNVRHAKLDEKHATDTLHDANVKLQRDRQTEAQYLKKGIAAYPGYTSAVQGLASAQRSLASAQRASVAAGVAQKGELAKLSPIERKLAATFKLISGAFEKAFGPALNALFGGLNGALRIFAKVLTDPKIVRALKGIGKAFGSVFIVLAKSLSSKEFRDSFVALANGGARLVKILGSRVFKDILKIFTRIAIAALPALVGLLGDFADTLDRWAKWIQKNPKQFKKDIDGLIGSFKGWLGVIIDVGGFLIDLGVKLKNLGDKAGSIFRGLKGDVSDLLGGTSQLSDHFDKLNTQHLAPLTPEPQTKPQNARGLLGFDSKDMDAISGAIGRVGLAMHRIIDTVKPGFVRFIGGMEGLFRGFVQTIAGLISGKWSEAWRGVKTIVVSALRAALGFLQTMVAPFTLIGRRLGGTFVKAFKSAFGAVKSFIRTVGAALYSVLQFVVDQINKLNIKIPDKIPVIGGHHIGVHVDLPDNPFAQKRKPNLNTQHLPALTNKPRAVASAAPTVQGTATAPTTIQQFGDIVLPPAPAAAVQDARYQARQFALLTAKRA